MLSGQDTWSIVDGGFNMEAFFLNIVELFESDPEDEWAASTLEHWTL